MSGLGTVSNVQYVPIMGTGFGFGDRGENARI